MSFFGKLIKSPKWLWGIFRIRNYDRIVLYSSSSGSLLACFFIITGRKCIIHQGSIPEERPWSLRRYLFFDLPLRFALKRSMCWYNDDPLVETYAKKYSKKAIEVRNSIDLQRFRPKEKESRDYFELGIVGPFDPVYNKPGLEWLEKSRNHFLIGTRIRIIEDLNDLEYVNALQSLDALIVPRFVRTLCPQSKVLEGMACGIPVIQTKLSTPPQGSQSGRDIFIVEKEGLIGAVTLLYQDRELCRRIGARARIVIEENYSNQISKKAMLDSLS